MSISEIGDNVVHHGERAFHIVGRSQHLVPRLPHAQFQSQPDEKFIFDDQYQHVLPGWSRRSCCSLKTCKQLTIVTSSCLEISLTPPLLFLMLYLQHATALLISFLIPQGLAAARERESSTGVPPCGAAGLCIKA
jgi:hypothetical protein